MNRREKFACDGCDRVAACTSPDGRSLLCLRCRVYYQFLRLTGRAR